MTRARLGLNSIVFLNYYKRLVQNLFLFIGPEKGAHANRFRIIVPKKLIPLVYQGTGLLSPTRATFLEVNFAQNSDVSHKSFFEITQHYDSKPLNYRPDSFVAIVGIEHVFSIRKKVFTDTPAWILPFLMDCKSAQEIMERCEIGVLESKNIAEAILAIEHCSANVCPSEMCQKIGKKIFEGPPH